LNIDYIIETYCVNKEKPELQCNGKCHLAKQLQVVQQETQNDEKSAINVVFEAFYPLYIQSSNLESDINVSFNYSKKKWFLSTSRTANYIDELFHPPRFVS